MKKKLPKVTLGVSPENEALACLGYAREYHEAAKTLFQANPDLTRVINGLYFHTAELLLKAFLFAHGESPWGHEIDELYKSAMGFGLKLNSRDPNDLGNVISLLKSGNEDMAFRYGARKSLFEPDSEWTRDVLIDLMQVVSRVVGSLKEASATPIPTYIRVTVKKPTNRS